MISTNPQAVFPQPSTVSSLEAWQQFLINLAREATPKRREDAEVAYLLAGSLRYQIIVRGLLGRAQ